MSRIVLFDLDRTMLAADSEVALVRRLVAARAVPLGTMAAILRGYLRYRVAPGAELQEVKRTILRRLLAGRPVGELVAVADAVVADDLLPRLTPASLAALALHRDAGDRIALVSAAVDLIVEPVARALDIDLIACTTLARADGRFTGEVVGTMPMGSGKAEVLRALCAEHGGDPLDAVAYADHFSDRHMLELVGTPVVINPAKRMASFALARGWRIERWPGPQPAQGSAAPAG
jgi:HAD superfamily hydrolase (TIGR01490 family)